MLNQNKYQRLNNFFNSPLLFVIFCFFYPLVFLIQVNSHLYTCSQIGVTLLFMLTVFVISTFILGIIVYFSIKLFLKTLNYCGLIRDDYKRFSKIYCAILAGFGILILTLLLHKTNRDLIPIFNTLIWGVLYLIVAFGIVVFAYNYQLKSFNFILGVLLIINGALIIISASTGAVINSTTKSIKQNIVFKQKPNVYFVILESYASLANRRITYGIDNAPLIKELNQNKYVIYKTYSNYQHSLASVASIFMMDHHYYKLSKGNADGYYRNIIGAEKYNSVLNIFLKNGYRVDYNKFSPYLYNPSSSVKTQLVRHALQPIEVINGFLFFLDKISKHFSLHTGIYQSLFWLSDVLQAGFVKTIERDATKNDRKPVFYAVYMGAEHTPCSFDLYPKEIRDIQGAQKLPLWKLNRINNYWIETYKNIVTKSDAALIEFIRDIDEKDPKAIVILIGDHAPRLNYKRWMGKYEDLNKNLLENGIQPSEMTRDMFEIFLAIKWPQSIEMADEHFSPVNLFRYIFAALTNDSHIIKSRVSDDSFVLARSNDYFGGDKIYIVVNEGKILDRWVPCSVPVSQ